MLILSALCWHHLFFFFFLTRRYQKIQKIYENKWYWPKKYSYLLKVSRNFNEIFREDVTYNNIKSEKKVSSSLSRWHSIGKAKGSGFSGIMYLIQCDSKQESFSSLKKSFKLFNPHFINQLKIHFHKNLLLLMINRNKSSSTERI